MSILVGKQTRLVVQGITGREGSYHTEQMLDYGTPIVAGVTPGRGGGSFKDIPIFDSVAEATEQTGCNTSIIFVPPPFAGDAIVESAAADLELVVCITEGIPVIDTIRAVRFAQEAGVRVVGPNCPGIMTPDEAKVGIMPASSFARGHVGVISRSGTLTYEVVDVIKNAGLGVSTCVGIGGDPVIGSTFVDHLRLFNDDPDTEKILIIGEIGGSDEEVAAEYVRRELKKPVWGFISGRSAPPGKRMGHAGAIISGTSGTPQAKVAAFLAAGIPVADTLQQMVKMARDNVRL